MPLEKQAFYHDLDFTMVNYELALGYSLAPWLTVETNIPLRTAYTGVRFLNEADEALEGFESIHHRNETLVGIGDVTFGARFNVLSGLDTKGLVMLVSTGLSVPSGSTRPNPFALARAGQRHQHIFFGTGTVDPYLSAAMTYRMGWGRVSGFVHGRVSLYENRYGYRGPGVIYGGVDTASDFGLDVFEASVGIHAMREFPATWGDENAENSGRTDLMAALGVSWRMSDAWRLRAGAKVPFYTEAIGGQLDIPIIADLGVAFSGNILN
ncbi:MAG: hypothetical protein ACPGU1_12345 [Myxococcota bacterium]